jgi:hypothetical protein
MRLSGWQRIGIIASVIWALAGPFYLDSISQSDWLKASLFRYETCRMNPSRHDCDEVSREYADSLNIPRFSFRTPEERRNWALAAFVPTAFGWLVVYTLVYLVRWIRAGFQP